MTDGKKPNRKEFAAPQSQDFTIRDAGGVIGHLRVKPNAIAWKGKSQQQYHQVSIEEFATFAAENGRKVKI